MRTETTGNWLLACSAVGFLACSAAFAAPPSLDGFVNDPFWSEKGRSWTLHDPAQPGTVSRCFLGYDEQYLYFAADVSDANVVGTNRTPKSRAWEDDAIKLLLHVGDPQAPAWTAETFSYTFSATGGVNWQRGPLPANPDPADEPGWPSAWNSGVNWAVGLKPGTTPNVSGPPDRGYAVEARIPWSELGVRPPFAPGATLGICIVNICRPELSLENGKTISSVASARAVTPLEPNRWQRVRMDWYGPVAIRGLVEALPLWLGSPAWEYTMYGPGETAATSRWWDRARWAARLDRMRAQNMNTLVLRHTNPWTGLLAPATAQTRPAESVAELISRAGWFAPEEFPRVRDQFSWILAEAEKHGIQTYLLLTDESAAFPKPPTTAPSGASADPQADVLASLAKRLLEMYPGLSGIGAGTGFNSPAMLTGLAKGMQAAPPQSATAAATATATSQPNRRELLVWSDGTDPKTVAAIVDQYSSVQLLQPLHHAHWHKPLADAGLQEFGLQVDQARTAVAAEPLPNIAIGNLAGPLSYMLWADPQWARTLMLDIRNQGLQGFLLDTGPSAHRLAREALFEYAYNAGQQFSPQRWESRLQVYGVGEYSGQLLEALQHASAVMPELLLLINEPSPRFMPQFGLLLTHYTQLSSLSASLDPNRPQDKRAALLPKLGPAWAEPVWGQSISSVREEAERTAPPDAISASEVAARISRHVDACNSLLPALRHIKPPSPEQAAGLSALLDAIELNVALGDHMANKIRAAIGWEQYKARRGRMIDCMQPLQKSVEAWQKVAELAGRIYPASVEYWQSQPVSPPPWSVEYVRSTYVPVVGHWRDQLPRFERELELIRAAMGGTEIVHTLPLWDHVNAVPDGKRQTRFVIDFENPDQRFRLFEGATVQEMQDERLAGKKSLLADARSLPPGRHELFITDAGHVPLMSAQKYQVSLLYRVVEPGKGEGEPFEIGVRPLTGGKPLGDRRTWTAPAGYTGARILQVPPPQQDGNVLYIAVRSGAAVLIDAVQIAQVIE